MHRPLVSVVISCKNTAEHFDACLKSVKAQTYPNIEIVIVDNFSTDGTYEIAKKYTGQVYQLGPERSTQFNYGFTKSKGAYIYRIGPDYVLEPDLIEKCVTKIQEGYDALALHNRSVGDSVWAKVRFLERESYRNDQSIVAVRFMKREVFRDAGMFDENLVMAEDFDLHNRIVAAGYKWAHVDAVEGHIGEPKNLADVWHKFYYYGRTIGRYYKKSGDVGKQQLVFFRPSFRKLQVDLIKQPHLFIAFWFYMVVKYIAGAAGYLRGAPQSLTQQSLRSPHPMNPPIAKQPLISVIIPAKNSAKFLDRCLASVKQQTYPHIEIILIDNHSTDATREIAARYTDRVFIKGPERSAQTNYGVEQAKGEFIYKVDSDFVLDPNVVTQAVAKLHEGFDAVVVHNTPDESISWLAKIRKFEIDMYKYSLSNSVARIVNKDLPKIGGLNPDIIFGEDYDFQNRLNKHGYKTGFIDAEALHLGEPTSFWPHIKKFYFYGKDFINYQRHNPQEARKQAAFFRGPFWDHRMDFVRRPLMGLAFLGYNISKYAAGGIGYAVGLMAQRRSVQK